MKRQKITFLLTLLFSMMVLCASAHDFEVDGIYYVYNDGANGSSVSVSYRGNSYYQYDNEYSGNLTIPPSVTYNGRTYSVTSICDYAFYNCSSLTKVTIPNSVTNIGNYTFQGCSGLTNVDIPNSVTSIGNSVFQSCSRLTSITIPNSVTRIGDSAFQGCSGITSVTIPNSVISIGRAFSYMSKLESIKVDPENTVYDSRENCNAIIETKTNTLIAGCYKTAIPDDIKAIGFWAFQGQSKLTSISIPYGVTTINELAFYGTGLSSISLPNSVSEIGYMAFESTPWYDNQPDGLIYVGKVAYKYKGTMPENTSITIKEGTLGIAGWAFNYCNNFVSVTLPNSVTNIGNYAFYRCGFSSITIPQSVTMIGGCVFEDTPWYNSLPDGLVYINNVLYCDKGEKSGPSIEVKEGTNCISSWAFLGNKNLSSIVIPSSVNIIGTTGLGVFQDCTNLVNVTIDKQEPLSINEWDFTNRSNATLSVPYGCKAAYEAAPYWKEFKEIVEMPSQSPNIVFSDSNVKALCVANWDSNNDGELSEAEAAAVTDLGVVFKDNTSIKSFNELQYFTGLTNIGRYAFYHCSGLTSITIPSNITSIGEWAFVDSGLNSVVIPNSITTIGGYAFHGTHIESVSIPSSVTSIGEAAFGYCQELTSIMVDSQNSKYNSYNNCNAIIETETNTLLSGCINTIIPSGVEKIGNYAFRGCKMTSVNIPLSVSAIGAYAFSSCENLVSVTIPSMVTSIGEWAFFLCTSLTSVTIPTSVTTIGNCVFEGCYSLTSVTVKWETPVSINDRTFPNRTNYILYVPYGCKSAYEAADYWKNFKEIVEMEPTDVEVTDVSQLDNVIYIEPTEGRCGSQTTLSVKMKNDVAIQTIQFDLYLPDGITIVPNEDDELVTASKERINKFNYFDSSMQSDGALRLLAQATTTNVPAGDGEICRIVVDIPESMEEGDYPLVIKGALMVEMDNTSHSPDPNLVQTKLTVLKYVLGDANNDGEVNAIDFNMIGNYILGRTQNNFNLKAADISGDSEVNAIDFNMVGNMILNGSTASARERTTEDAKDPE